MNENKRLVKSLVLPALLTIALAPGLAPPAQAADLSGSYTWKPISIGAGGWIKGMVTHPLSSTVRYCRGDIGQVYRWDNANSVWKPMDVSTGMPANVIAAPASAGGGAIAVDPSNVNKVLCAYTIHRSADLQGTNPDIPLNVYRSADGGQTFTAGNLSLSGDDLSDEARGERMKVDPNNGNVVYLGSKTHGLWRSMDGGATWSNVTANGAPASNSSAVIPWIDKGGGTVSFGGQTVSKRLYIIMDFGPVLQSDDGGNSWTNVSDVEYVGKNVIASTLDASGTLWVGDIPNYGNISKRTRAGVWSTCPANPPGGVAGIAVDPANTSRAFVVGGGINGLCRTTNGGTSWTRLGANGNYSTTQTIQWLRPSSIRPNGHWVSVGALCMDPSGKIWISGGNDGVLSFTPNDAVDSDATPPTLISDSQGIEELVGHHVIIPPGGYPILNAEDEGAFTILNPDAYTALHHGLNYWDPLNTPNTGLSEGQDLNYCPNQPAFVVATSDNGFYGREPIGAGQMYSSYSTDKGLTWTKFGSITNGTNPCPLYCGLIAVAPRAAGHQNDGPGADIIVRVPSDVGGGALQGITAAPFYSTDGGAHWTQTTSFNGTAGATTQNRCGTNYTYLGYHCGPWTNLIHQHLLEADPLIRGTFYFQPTNLGFWKSTDNGATWVQQAGTGLPTQTHHGQLHANPNVSGDLWFVDGYEGASPHGLFHTTNSGASFTAISGWDYCWQLALGKASGSYPAIYVYGKRTGDPAWGVFRSVDTGATWDRISNYPAGLIDMPGGMAASWDTFGLVYMSMPGNTGVYGQPSGGSPPPAPTGLTATAGNTQVVLNWSVSSGATAYDVKRSTVSGSGYVTVSSPTTNSYTNTGLTNGTTYYFVVDAKNASGTSANSAQASATPTAVPQAQIIAGTATIDGTAEAAWNAATAYTLTKTTGTISGSSDCSATWKGMWDSTNLYILATVTDDVKKNDSTVTWDDDAVEVYLDADHNGGTTYDANDRQLVFGWGDATVVEGAGRTTTGVTFAKSDPNGTTYIIEAKIPWALEVFTPAANNIIGIDVHVDDDDDGGTRDGKVIWNDGTDGAWGNPSLFGSGKLLVGSPPAAPTGLTATGGNAQVALSWTASSGATSYNVKRSTVNGSGYAQVTNVATTSYTNTGLTNGTAYYFVVTALNANGESGNSNQASATPVSGTDSSVYNFEAGTQSWSTGGAEPCTISSSTTKAYLGTHSLQVNITGTGVGAAEVRVSGPSTPAGALVTYHVWVPSGAPIGNVTIYLQGGAPNNTWTGAGGAWTGNTWNTFTVTCPASGSAPLGSLGVDFNMTAAWTGTVYVDSVSW